MLSELIEQLCHELKKIIKKIQGKYKLVENNFRNLFYCSVYKYY